MASNGAKEPSWSLDPAAQKAKRQLRKQRYLHSGSSPLADLVPPETNGNGSIPHYESKYGKFNPSYGKVAIYFAVYLGTGVVIFYLGRHQIKGKKTDAVLDALYFTIVTMTTVGYGDIVPDTALTKLLTCAFVFTGMALVGLLLTKSGYYLVEKH